MGLRTGGAIVPPLLRALSLPPQTRQTVQVPRPHASHPHVAGAVSARAHQRRREELTLHFLKEEGRRIGRDILISRGAETLAGTNFEENVRGLRDCITNCCAEAYLDTKGDSTIRTYQLPSAILPAPH
ncbi:MAG: hypothetical protein ACLU37_04790 [Collinsella sp.]